MRVHRENKQKSLAGSLLLAHPSLRDENFRRTVILMTTHGADGAMGVIVNRPLHKRLGALAGDFALGPMADVPVFKGGPVQEEQLILAGWRTQPHGFQLHLGIDPDKAGPLLAEDGTRFRAFLGYAGWSAGQLENELKSQSWIVTETPSDLFSQPEGQDLWRVVLGREGAEWQLLADEPEEPEAN